MAVLNTTKNAEQFYNTYKIRVSQTFSSQISDSQKSQTLSGFLPQTSKNPIQQVFSAEADGYKIMQQAAQFLKLGWSHFL